MEYGYREPVYAMGIIVKFLKVCPATLRIWERKGLIKPARLGKNRFYSRFDLNRLERIKDLIQKGRLNIAGVKHVLQAPCCWEIKKCQPKERNKCLVYLQNGKENKN
jgi:MerR family transcriptional regulator, heat shock protein HspR